MFEAKDDLSEEGRGRRTPGSWALWKGGRERRRRLGEGGRLGAPGRGHVSLWFTLASVSFTQGRIQGETSPPPPQQQLGHFWLPAANAFVWSISQIQSPPGDPARASRLGTAGLQRGGMEQCHGAARCTDSTRAQVKRGRDYLHRAFWIPSLWSLAHCTALGPRRSPGASWLLGSTPEADASQCRQCSSTGCYSHRRPRQRESTAGMQVSLKSLCATMAKPATCTLLTWTGPVASAAANPASTTRQFPRDWKAYHPVPVHCKSVGCSSERGSYRQSGLVQE